MSTSLDPAMLLDLDELQPVVGGYLFVYCPDSQNNLTEICIDCNTIWPIALGYFQLALTS